MTGETDMTNTKGKWLYRSLLAGIFVLMLLMNALSPWVADDYHYAFSFATGERLSSVADIFPSLQAHGSIMNGRYTPHFLLQLFTLLPWWVFDVCNSLVFVMMTAGMVRLICGRRKYDSLMLCGLTAAVFAAVPAFGASFLWMAGSCNYLWCDVLLIWLLVPFADAMLERGNQPSRGMQLLMIPAALFFGNMSQNVSACGVMLMGLSILWLAFKRRPIRLWMLSSALAALIGWILCLSSPADIEHISVNTTSLGQIMRNFQTAAEFMIENGSLLGIAALILMTLRWFEGGDRTNVAIAAGFFLAAMACNYVMAASHYYPSRAFTGSALLFICSCGFAIPKLHQPRFKAVLAVCLAFVMGISLLSELPDLYSCLAKYNERQALVAQAVANGERELSTYGVLSQSRFDCFFEVHDMTIYPDQPVNRCFAKYYGLDSIVAERFE